MMTTAFAKIKPRLLHEVVYPISFLRVMDYSHKI